MFNLLKQEINNFPDVLKKFLIEDFFSEYKKYLWFLKKEFQGKLTRTNNSSEMYSHTTLPKAEKKRYRTKEGIFNQICNRKKWDGWKNWNSNQQIDRAFYLYLKTLYNEIQNNNGLSYEKFNI